MMQIIEQGLTCHVAVCLVLFSVTTCLKKLKMSEFNGCQGIHQKSWNCHVKNLVRENFLLLTSHLGLS